MKSNFSEEIKLKEIFIDPLSNEKKFLQEVNSRVNFDIFQSQHYVAYFSQLEERIKEADDYLLTTQPMNIRPWLVNNKSTSPFLTKLYTLIQWFDLTLEDHIENLKRELVSLSTPTYDEVELKPRNFSNSKLGKLPTPLVESILTLLNIRERARIVTVSKNWRNIIENITVGLIPLIRLQNQTDEINYLVVNFGLPKTPLYQLRKLKKQSLLAKTLSTAVPRDYFEAIDKKREFSPFFQNIVCPLVCILWLGQSIYIKCSLNPNFIPILTCDFSTSNSYDLFFLCCASIFFLWVNEDLNTQVKETKSVEYIFEGFESFSSRLWSAAPKIIPTHQPRDMKKNSSSCMLQ